MTVKKPPVKAPIPVAPSPVARPHSVKTPYPTVKKLRSK